MRSVGVCGPYASLAGRNSPVGQTRPAWCRRWTRPAVDRGRAASGHQRIQRAEGELQSVAGGGTAAGSRGAADAARSQGSRPPRFPNFAKIEEYLDIPTWLRSAEPRLFAKLYGGSRGATTGLPSTARSPPHDRLPRPGEEVPSKDQAK